MKRPLVCLALVFSFGIIVADKIKVSSYLPYSLLAIFLILAFLSFKKIAFGDDFLRFSVVRKVFYTFLHHKKRMLFDIFLFFLVFTLGAVLLKNTQNLPRCHIYNFVHYKNEQPYLIKGYINSQPIVKNNRNSFIFKTQAIQAESLNYSCCGNILVYLKGKKELHYGEELILRGNLYRPFNSRDSRRQSYRDYLYNQAILFIMNVKSAADVIRLNKNRGFMIKRFALWLKHKMEERIFRHTSSLSAAILDAMILGERRNIPSFVNNTMMKSGTVHILVVSGFNVGIVSFIVILFLKLLRLPRKIRFAIAIPYTIIYCLITGASTPVLRATVMAVFFMLGCLIKREEAVYNSLSVAWLFILGLNPRQLFDIGLQLSFASVVAIVYLYPALSKFLVACFCRKGGVYPKIKFIRFLIDGCLVSFTAWLATSGFIAYYFKIFSPVTVLANIFIVPLAALITLCGFSLILISLIFLPLAPFFSSATELLVILLIKINAFLVQLPAAYFYLS